MRFLKHRRQVYAVPSQSRAHRLTVIRWLYLASVLALAIWLVNLFFGGLLYLQSEGLVLGDPWTVSAEFPVTVRDVLVREGDVVEKGQIAVLVTSQSVTETIARLTAEIAARQARLSELRIRSEVVDALLDLATNRQKIATDALQQLEKLLAHQYLALNQHTAAVEMDFRSHQDLEALRAEKRIGETEINTLSVALAEAERALSDLRTLYDEGRLRIPVDGVISRVISNSGSVVRAGEPLVELHGNQRYILAYLPVGGFYDVTIGDGVKINMGLRSARGVITRIEPFAPALPREFQRAFTPVERQQLIRVEFAPGEVPPPLFTKVRLRSLQVVPHWIGRTWSEWRPWG
ncbi:MAG: HlyD family secretion protein [Vulcanimicrobiaceae bacterium]